MNRTIYTIAFLLSTIQIRAQTNCNPKDFELLKSACRKSTLTEIEFLNHLKAVKKLEDSNCFEYVEKRDGQEYVETGLTYLFGQLVLVANSDKSVQEYINYLDRHVGSAEEQRSFSFEYIFRKNPKRVLMQIGFNTEYLDLLAWGFMNNRWYGENDPYEKDPNKAYTRYDSEPKRVLNVKSYKDIFYKTYPSLKNEVSFKRELDYLLKAIGAGLKEREE